MFKNLKPFLSLPEHEIIWRRLLEQRNDLTDFASWNEVMFPDAETAIAAAIDFIEGSPVDFIVTLESDLRRRLNYDRIARISVPFAKEISECDAQEVLS